MGGAICAARTLGQPDRVLSCGSDWLCARRPGRQRVVTTGAVGGAVAPSALSSAGMLMTRISPQGHHRYLHTSPGSYLPKTGTSSPRCPGALRGPTGPGEGTHYCCSRARSGCPALPLRCSTTSLWAVDASPWTWGRTNSQALGLRQPDLQDLLQMQVSRSHLGPVNQHLGGCAPSVCVSRKLW